MKQAGFNCQQLIIRCNSLFRTFHSQDIVEAGRIIELLKEQGIAAFSQEAGASVAMHGAPGFGMYGVDVSAEGDEAKKAIQIIEAADDSQSKEKF